jgi:putative FmdB family regulatory protein
VPIYEYRCGNGHNFEVTQSMSDDPIATCQECSAPVERVFHPVAVHFKGSGFYTTDYGRKRSHGSETGSGDSAKTESKETSDSTAAKSDSGDNSESSGSGSGSASASSSSD